MLNKTSNNRLIYTPEQHVRAFGQNLIFKPTDHFCKYASEAGFVLPDTDDSQVEKKYDIGVVVSIGSDITHDIKVGDVIIWQCTSAWRLPNGADMPLLYQGPVSAIIAVLDNPDTAGPDDVIRDWHERNSGNTFSHDIGDQPSAPAEISGFSGI